ncbi:hypothetical protein [Streptomyces guryensis]|uniref:Uncharacterized protein n=1 Tax=Streptomyces guryensis TaxID=2886947 RepID=A0A9Q3VWU9_9ACTN|nr:hypothetical protein [Streptomyces guryensis]MCD9879227.1 hypothetical protein [Streptomyces guryensis]
MRPAAPGGAGDIVLGVRPEQFEFLSTEDRETPGLDLVVETVEDTGAVVHLHTTAWSARGSPASSSGSRDAPSTARGPLCGWRFARGVHCFSALTGQRLPEDADASPVT